MPNLADVDGDELITFRDLNDNANLSFVSDRNSTGFIDAGDLLDDPSWEDGTDGDGNGFIDDLVGWDFLDNDNDPKTEQTAHGTGMAGIIGANHEQRRRRRWRELESVQIMPLRHQRSNQWIPDVDSSMDIQRSPSLNYAVENGASISANSWLMARIPSESTHVRCDQGGRRK